MTTPQSFRTLLTLLFVGVLLLGACKKDGGSSGSSDSKAKLLTSGSWTLQDYQKRNGQGTWVSENDPYMTHYTVTFYSNSTYVEVGTNQQSSWSANADFSQLTLGNGTDAFGTYRVIALTSTSLQLENLNPADDELDVYTH